MSIFSDLREGTPVSEWKDGQEGLVSGYRAFDGYPTAFQAAEFPLHGDEARITGNNMAFFFVEGVKEDGQVVDVKLQTKHLSTLMGNILVREELTGKRPVVHLQVDADIFENPKRFVDKYAALRSEPAPMNRNLLAKEADLIRTFVLDGGLEKVARAAILTGYGATFSPEKLKQETTHFLNNAFRFEGVRTTTPLGCATWEINTPEGGFCACQKYKINTYMLDRPWQLGMNEELHQLAAKGHKGAEQLLRVVKLTRDMPTVALG